MKAIHVNWTKPYFEKHRLRGHGFESIRHYESDTYNLPDYQILYTILSILHWKKHNGPIKLYTDSVGASFYHRFNLLDLYDEVDIDFLNKYSKSKVDPAYFWTSGKIKCLAHQTEPFVFMDNDMIIKENPDVLIIDGPPTYLLGYIMSYENLRKSIKNLKRIVEKMDFKTMILDHHLLRDYRYRDLLHEVYETGKKLGKNVITAAEYNNKKPVVIEGYEKYGPTKWKKWEKYD